jgi:hypothetical protein
MDAKDCLTTYVTSITTTQYRGEVCLGALRGKWVIEDILYRAIKSEPTRIPIVVVIDGVVHYEDIHVQ